MGVRSYKIPIQREILLMQKQRERNTSATAAKKSYPLLSATFNDLDILGKEIQEGAAVCRRGAHGNNNLERALW
jgi:hypothetical protein